MIAIVLTCAAIAVLILVAFQRPSPRQRFVMDLVESLADAEHNPDDREDSLPASA